jgi:predicted  nucleic acid-binding Zn-ribbon protein
VSAVHTFLSVDRSRKLAQPCRTGYAEGTAMSPDLERLIQLQQLDQEIEVRRKALADLPIALAALDARVAAKQEGLTTAKQKLTDNQAARRNLDKDLAVIQGRLTKFKDQLMEVKTNKEYTAVQHEISMAQDSVRGFEDQILELLVQADELDAGVKAADGALSKEKGEVAKERAAREQATSAMGGEIETLLQQRGGVVSEMSREILALFEHVSRKHRGSVVAEARDGHCTACHVRLRPQVFNEVRRGDRPIQCDSCQRILFVMPAKPTTSTGVPTN